MFGISIRTPSSRMSLVEVEMTCWWQFAFLVESWHYSYFAMILSVWDWILPYRNKNIFICLEREIKVIYSVINNPYCSGHVMVKSFCWTRNCSNNIRWKYSVEAISHGYWNPHFLWKMCKLHLCMKEDHRGVICKILSNSICCFNPIRKLWTAQPLSFEIK